MLPESPEFPGLSFAAGLENPGKVLRSGTNETLEKCRVIVPLFCYSSRGTLYSACSHSLFTLYCRSTEFHPRQAGVGPVSGVG